MRSVGARGLAALLACGACALLSATPALAYRGHVLAGAFDGKTPGSGQFEKFEDPSGIAVGEASGDVYVISAGKVRVERFDEDGSAFEGSFNGGETPARSFSNPEAIAIDNACSLREQRTGEPLTQGACEALDPSDGDVYVLDAGHGVIDKFSASGKYLSQLAGTCAVVGEAQPCEHSSLTPFGALYGVTVGETGTLWVASAGTHGEGLLSSFNDLPLNRFEGSVTAAAEAGASERSGLAVNAQGDAYESFAYPLEAEAFVAELSPGGGVLDSWVDGQPLHEPVPGTAPPGLAVEPASGQLYVDDTTSLARYAPDGALIERLGEGELTGAGSVAVDRRSETVYVVDSVAGTVSVFTPEAPGAPVVSAEHPTEVAATSVRLQAQVDPRGAGTSYYVEYGRCATLAGCPGAGYEASAPAVPATLGADFETHTVSVPVDGLQPDSAYHYRVVAENDAGGSGQTVRGAEQTFTTQASGSRVALPDGREWELVSPADKHGASVGVGGVARSAADGQSVVYPASAPTETGIGGGGVLVVSQRGGEAWASRDVDADGGETALLEAFAAGGCSGCAVSGVEDAEALGALGVLGTSEDGSYVYFVANGVLTGEADSAGEHAVQGACQTTGLTRRPQLCNLYEQHMGGSGWEAPRLVAVLSSADYPDWSAQLEHHTARVAPDGEWVAFMSERSLTGYDNEDVTSARPGERLDQEVYLYRAGAGVVCASCNPTGMRPEGVQYSQIEASHGGLAGGEGVWPSSAWIAASVPGWASYEPGALIYQPRYLSNGGRLFFDSSDELVAQDINSSEDVYEYEPAGYTSAQGQDDCASTTDTSYSETAKGCVALISSGVSSGEAVFLDASESGGDVFFLTTASLVAQDTDANYDVYDAHECTAAAPCYSEPVAQPPQCETIDSCRPSSSTPSTSQPPIVSLVPGPIPVRPSLAQAGVLGERQAAAPQPTRAQQLAAALARCHKQRAKTKRAQCERAARARYGTRTSSSHTKTKKGGKGGSR